MYGITVQSIWYYLCISACVRSCLLQCTFYNWSMSIWTFARTSVPGPLQGHLKVDILDSAYAILHVGIFGFDLTIFKAELCVKGHIEYELNILKVSIFTFLFHSNILCIVCSFALHVLFDKSTIFYVIVIAGIQLRNHSEIC